MAKATMLPRFRLPRTLLVTKRTTKPYNSLQRDRQAVLPTPLDRPDDLQDLLVLNRSPDGGRMALALHA